MSDNWKKGFGYLLTGGIFIAAGIGVGLTGALPVWVTIIGTVVGTIASVFGINLQGTPKA